jgi:catechol 2,3-dioxygenase-like lactoylglutathione lyase family enzyme
VANQTGRPIAPARKLVAAVMGTLAVFVIVYGLGMSSWAVALFGLAVLALAVILAMVNVPRRGGRATVAGNAEVKVIPPVPVNAAYGRADIEVIVVAPGLGTFDTVLRESRIPVAKWPAVGSTIPITVDVDDTRRVRVSWNDAPLRDEGADPPPPQPAYTEPDERDDDLLGDIGPAPWEGREQDWQFEQDEPPPPPPPPSRAAYTAGPTTPVVVRDTPGGTIVEGQVVGGDDEPPPPLPRRAAGASAYSDPIPPPPPPPGAGSSTAYAAGAAPFSGAASSRPRGARPSPRPRGGGAATATVEREDTTTSDVSPEATDTTTGAQTAGMPPTQRTPPASAPAEATPDDGTPDEVAPDDVAPDDVAPAHAASTAAASAPAETEPESPIDLPLEEPEPEPERAPSSGDQPSTSSGRTRFVMQPNEEPTAEFPTAATTANATTADATKTATTAGAAAAGAAAGAAAASMPPQPRRPEPTPTVGRPEPRPEPVPASTASAPSPVAPPPVAPSPDRPFPSAPLPETTTAPATPHPVDDIDIPLDDHPEPAPETTPAASAAVADDIVAPPAEEIPESSDETPAAAAAEEIPEPSSAETPAAPAAAAAAAVAADSSRSSARTEEEAGAPPAAVTNPWGDLHGRPEPDAHAADLFTAYPSARPGPGGAIHGVGVTVLVTDLDQSVAFYRGMLGFYEIDSGEASAVLASGDTRVVLRTVHNLAPEAGRLINLNLEVGDVQAVYEELRAKGVKFVSTPRVVDRGGKLELWSATFRDPDNHSIAITQWRAIR